jgi:hypothetical protein
MIVDKKHMLFERLQLKNLDHVFRSRIEQGMGCSPFVSEAICNAVKEVYLPALHASDTLKPGQLLFACLSQSNEAGIAIKDSVQVTIVLTLDDGPQDLLIRQKQGVEALRRHRLVRLCQQAYQQEGLLTVEDLAYRLLNVGERTIHRDLAVLRQQHIHPPLRSTVKDIGRTISHRSTIVKNWLFGDELSDLQRKYHHSLPAIENYINTFKRLLSLKQQNHSVEQSAYLLKISRPLVHAYYDIWRQYGHKALPHRRKELLDTATPAQQRKKTMPSRRRAS